MSKLPFMQFFPGDWIKDTRCLSLEARGAWIDLLCLLWDSKTRGTISWPASAFDQFLGTIDRGECIYSAREIIKELQQLGICDVVTDCNGIVTLSCRRMVREESLRKQTYERVKRHRNADSNAPVTQTKRRIYQKSDIRSQKSEDSYKNKNPESAASPEVSNETKQEKTKTLNARIKTVADRIFAVDRVRYGRLIQWIRASQANMIHDDRIADALERFEPMCRQASIEWWPYLNKILAKVETRANGQAHEDKTNLIKEEEVKWLKQSLKVQ